MRSGNTSRLNSFSLFDAAAASRVADDFGTPAYVYDESLILEKCRNCLEMPNAFGLTVRYAMKANSNRTLLRLITGAGLHLDASSLNEVLRAHLAGVPYNKIMLTTQEVPDGASSEKLKELMLQGLKYNACSLRQLSLISDFAASNGIDPGIRVHPGIGSGESTTRNTGDDYACFGVHLSDIEPALNLANKKGFSSGNIHVHIASGADSDMCGRISTLN